MAGVSTIAGRYELFAPGDHQLDHSFCRRNGAAVSVVRRRRPDGVWVNR